MDRRPDDRLRLPERLIAEPSAIEHRSTAWLNANFPCRAACPVGTNAGGYVTLIARGHYEEAYALARRPNPFASVCGRVCAHPCEAACRRDALDAPVSIRALKRFVTERFGAESSVSYDDILETVERPRPETASPGHVAIVGAGPAGLSCAHDLRLMGHQVTVYEASSVAGGMMRLGIPEYRLPREALQAEIEFIRWLGVDIRYGFRVGRDLSFDELCATHDAVFIGTGCGKGRQPPIPGADTAGGHTAVDYLAAFNLGVALDVGDEVVVVGGGNVAFDVARTARRFGGTSQPDEPHHNLATDAAVVAGRVLRRNVQLLSLESERELPADPEELHEAGTERVSLLHRRSVVQILSTNGRVSGVITLDVRRVFDDHGRFAPETEPGTEQELACDTVVFATGQLADLSYLEGPDGPRVTPRHTLEVDRDTLATTREGVYAGGDVAFGPRIVIEAVADGRRAARSIDTYLTGRRDAPVQHVLYRFTAHGYDHPFARGDYEELDRGAVPEIEGEERFSFRPVELGYDEAQARKEGARCLHCWINTQFDSRMPEASQCIQCRGCVDVCPEACIDLIDANRVQLSAAVDGSHTVRGLGDPEALHRPGAVALLKNETRCIRCGLCARRCPVNCIRMEAHYRADEMDLVRLADRIV